MKKLICFFMLMFMIVSIPVSAQQAVLQTGSLRSNIEKIAKQYGWDKVIWKSTYDYRWVNRSIIRKNKLQDVMREVLVNYPLQAVFYHGNHVLLIQPRALR